MLVQKTDLAKPMKAIYSIVAAYKWSMTGGSAEPFVATERFLAGREGLAMFGGLESLRARAVCAAAFIALVALGVPQRALAAERVVQFENRSTNCPYVVAVQRHGNRDYRMPFGYVAPGKTATAKTPYGDYVDVTANIFVQKEAARCGMARDVIIRDGRKVFTGNTVHFVLTGQGKDFTIR